MALGPFGYSATRESVHELNAQSPAVLSYKNNLEHSSGDVKVFGRFLIQIH